MPSVTCKVCEHEFVVADGVEEGADFSCQSCGEEGELKTVGTKWYLFQVEGADNP